jgi:hypothetical protein
MNSSINLLVRGTSGKSAIDPRKIRMLRMVAFVLLCSVAGLSVLLFITIASSPLGNLKKQEKEAQGKLSLLQTQFTKQLLIKNQLTTIATLLHTRANLVKTYQIVETNLPSDMTIKSLTINSISLSLSLRALSLAHLEKFLNVLKQKSESKELMATVAISGIVFDPVNRYYSLQVDIK